MTVLPTVIGTPYCSATMNSSGASSEIDAVGSIDPVQNNLTLSCTGMAPHTFGIFLTSRTQAFVANPGFSNGNLCLGGAIDRYVGPLQVKNSGAIGAISLALDLTQMPSPTGFHPVISGDTWNSQCWFRDIGFGVPASNFSNGLEVTLL